jgi:hypothetical protein
MRLKLVGLIIFKKLVLFPPFCAKIHDYLPTNYQPIYFLTTTYLLGPSPHLYTYLLIASKPIKPIDAKILVVFFITCDVNMTQTLTSYSMIR